MSDKDSSTPTKTIKEQAQQYDPFDRYEMIDHVRYDLRPSPTVNHQKLVVHLWQGIYNTCQRDGIILVAPIDVYLDEGNIFQPDLVFIANENERIIKEKRIEGAPDFIAEILSPNTSKNDKIRKKAQYERFGVQEYWIVDPVHFIVEQFVLKNGEYHLQGTYSDEDTIASDLFTCVSVNLDSLFQHIL